MAAVQNLYAISRHMTSSFHFADRKGNIFGHTMCPLGFIVYCMKSIPTLTLYIVYGANTQKPTCQVLNRTLPDDWTNKVARMKIT